MSLFPDWIGPSSSEPGNTYKEVASVEFISEPGDFTFTVERPRVVEFTFEPVEISFKWESL